jgi:hypothetical protein
LWSLEDSSFKSELAWLSLDAAGAIVMARGYTRSMLVQGSYQCSCCDYFSLHRRGSYDICPVCYWEDDGLSLGEIDEVSGPNYITLRQARQNFMRCGAADIAAVSLVASEAERGTLRREVRS